MKMQKHELAMTTTVTFTNTGYFVSGTTVWSYPSGVMPYPVDAEPIDVYLDRAADLIDQHGWCRGQYEDHRGHLCALGAIRRAIWGEDHNFGVCDVTPPHQAMIDYLCQRNLPNWNDKLGQRKTNVTAALRTVALMLRTTGKVTPMSRKQRSAEGLEEYIQAMKKFSEAAVVAEQAAATCSGSIKEIKSNAAKTANAQGTEVAGQDRAANHEPDAAECTRTGSLRNREGTPVSGSVRRGSLPIGGCSDQVQEALAEPA